MLGNGQEGKRWLLEEGGETREGFERLQEEVMAKRTIHRTSKGAKLYAVRTKDGSFKDIQTYKRVHGADLKKKGTKK